LIFKIKRSQPAAAPAQNHIDPRICSIAKHFYIDEVLCVPDAQHPQTEEDMDEASAADEPRAPGHAPIKTRRFSISLVWIVPVVAVLVGISLVVHNLLQEGPTIVVNFKTGSGLVANKTEVKYRSVVIGQVTDVELSGDQKSVDATIKLAKQAETFTREDSQFWVVRPRIGAGGVSGIDTLLSGDYIGADIGQANNRAKHFKGLENPPPITYGEPGKRFMLHASDLGSLDIGSRFTTARFRWARS
jgi:paraquat-inducible protein B